MTAYPDELVVAPVTITPTKPLTPTHLKGLLWTDVLVKASRQRISTRLVWNPRMAHLTTQTTAFWRHLDVAEPETDWSRESEAAIGLRYVAFHQGRPAMTARELDPYFERVESRAWIHPASRRLLELWRAQMAHLHVTDPGLTTARPLASDAGTALALLHERRLLVDHRRFGGPVLVDGTRWGLPVRQLIGADGHANYLLPILRELLPAIRPGRRFLLVHDNGLHADYLLLDRVLTVFGASVARLALSRVQVAGKAQSSKLGGWGGVTLGDLAATPGSADVAAYRLGMRLYFVGLLDRVSAQDFRLDLLRRCVGRAARILAQEPGEFKPGTVPDHPGGYADPHRLTVSLLGRRVRGLPPELREIFL
ncbi:hypothetical protein [Actinoplanes sp. TFC3]|uniref:hypothetical protein n=1 Tax=Actinoplanes sp. TFC3 TaxID=1710355 RepID=UPI00082E9559|nr:hypothetical protein [Actinoplanes sp. TFC3]